MKIDNCFLVYRPKDTVIVCIMNSEADRKYHFINLTKQHICACGFNSIEEAIQDMENQKLIGKIVNFEQI